MKKIICALLFLSTLAPLSAIVDEKMYIDTNELDMSKGRFKIHVGHNHWIETKSIMHDQSGLYTLESNILKWDESGYVKEWKCPYCYNWWPVKTPCQNKDCPSTYP